MPNMRYRICRGCGRSSREVGPLSWTRLCETCALAAVDDNVRQMAAHDGPNFQRWRRNCVAAFGGVLIDDLAPELTGDSNAR